MDTADTKDYPGILMAAAGIFIAYIAVYALIAADKLLIPLALAVLLWYLLNTIDHVLSHVSLRGRTPPRWLRLSLILTLMALVLNLITGIVFTSVSQIIRAAPEYQQNFEQIIRNLPFGIDLSDVPALSQWTAGFDIGAMIQRLAREFAALLGNMGLIAIYLVFLFLEGRYFRTKLAAVCGDEERLQRVLSILSRIDRDIKRYIGVKTLLSGATALGAWLIMRMAGLDFAGFWALLIFVLNFIPNLGSIAATLLPSMLALLQFDTLAPFFVVLLGIGTLQVLIGNLLDPALMGKSLNVSPLVIIISLVFWSVIWGLPGMFLCVPITVILIIILYNFDSTRWAALLLSRDGHLT